MADISSFIGHSLAAAGIYTLDQPDNPRLPRSVWLIWLILLSWAPDIDYILTFTRADGIRRTHSILFAALIPILTILALHLLRTPHLRTYSLQALTAGLSHLILDLLVGVTPLPLLWPLTDSTFRLPFGLLPSAGHLDLTNPYLWRNFLIELGILIPILILIHHHHPRKPQALPRWLIILPFITAIFTVWAFTLPR